MRATALQVEARRRSPPTRVDYGCLQPVRTRAWGLLNHSIEACLEVTSGRHLFWSPR